MRRRQVLKGLGTGAVASMAATGNASAAQVIDVYVYTNVPESLDSEIDDHARRCRDALDTLLTDVENSGHVDFYHQTHDRWKNQSAYPYLNPGDMSGWQDYLWDQGYTEGAEGNTAAYHMLVLTNTTDTHGGQSSEVTVFQGDTKSYSENGTTKYKVPRGMCNVDKLNLEEKMTYAHEMGHSLIDADIPAVNNMTHSCCSGGGCSDECPLCDKSTTGCVGQGEAIHNREHTLGTVINGGKSVMAHRSHTAAECYGGTDYYGNKLGCGVGGDKACDTGFTLATSHCTDKAIGYTENEYPA